MNAFRLRPMHVLAVLTIVVGCSKKSTSNSASDVYPAPHQALPQVITYGGPVQANPVLYAITTTDNVLAPQLIDFTRKIGTSSYFAVLAQYGVGPATFGTALTMPSPAVAISETSIQLFLETMLDGTHPEYGVPDVNSNYILYYPSTTNFSDGGCDSYYAYHDSLVLPSGTYANATVPYSVIPTCPPVPVTNGVLESQMEELTDAASHEIAEAATDPDQDNLAWDDTDNNSGAWDYVSFGGEIADMCQFDFNVDAFPADLGYYAQRIWSNSAASSALGIDPCQPTSAVYFSAAPVLGAKTTLNMGQGQGFTDNIGSVAVNIPVGGEATIPLQVFSSAATGPIALGASDGAAFFFFDTTPPNLTLTLDRSTALNGETANLTIHVVSEGADYPGGFEFFAVTATVGTAEQFWPGVVVSN